MVTKGTPRDKFKYKTSKKDLERSYELRLAAQFGDKKAKDKLAAYNRRIKERMMEANKTEWVVEGRSFNRYKMMDYIVTRVASGESLPDICSNQSMPSMLEVYSWADNHPDFVKEMNRAEEVRGHILGEKALEVALGTDRENVSADKLKFEALSKAAARLNQKYQDKQVVEQKDDYANLSPLQIRDRIKRMIESDPELAELVPASLRGDRQPAEEIDVQILSSELQSQDLALPETLSEDAS